MKKIEINAKTIGQVVNIEGDNAQVIHQGQPIAPQPTLSHHETLVSSELSDIFISYNRSDWEMYANPLVKRLHNAGLRVWIDQHLIESGANWQDEINRALIACRVLVLCMTNRALASPFVQTEYRYFINHRKPLIPVMCEPVVMPPELEGIQYLPFADLDKLVEKLRG